jgi:hypothetical protein
VFNQLIEVEKGWECHCGGTGYSMHSKRSGILTLHKQNRKKKDEISSSFRVLFAEHPLLSQTLVAGTKFIESLVQLNKIICQVRYVLDCTACTTGSTCFSDDMAYVLT